MAEEGLPTIISQPPKKKSRATCLIAAIAVIVLCALVAVVLVLGLGGLGLWISRSSTAPQASPVPIESATPASSESDTAEPDEDAATPEPGINTAPISSGSLDEMLDTMADDSQLSASRADGTLKRDVLRTIITNLAKSGCRVSIHGASVTSEPDDDGVWSETWDLSICDTRRALKIRFSPTSGGGTDFRITQ